MSAIIGLVVLFICVFGGFVIAGGSLAPIIKATPFEMFIIGGMVGATMIAIIFVPLFFVVFEEMSEAKKQMVADNPAKPGPHNLPAQKATKEDAQ